MFCRLKDICASRPLAGRRLLTSRAGAEVFTQVVLSYVAVRSLVGTPDPVPPRVLALGSAQDFKTTPPNVGSGVARVGDSLSDFEMFSIGQSTSFKISAVRHGTITQGGHAMLRSLARRVHVGRRWGGRGKPVDQRAASVVHDAKRVGPRWPGSCSHACLGRLQGILAATALQMERANHLGNAASKAEELD